MFEAKHAIANGTKKKDMVINADWAKNGNFNAIAEEIQALKKAASDKIPKVIIETTY